MDFGRAATVMQWPLLFLEAYGCLVHVLDQKKKKTKKQLLGQKAHLTLKLSRPTFNLLTLFVSF